MFTSSSSHVPRCGASFVGQPCSSVRESSNSEAVFWPNLAPRSSSQICEGFKGKGRLCSSFSDSNKLGDLAFTEIFLKCLLEAMSRNIKH